MSLFLRVLVLSRKMRSALCLSIVAFFTMGNAQAITIDFDDLNPADFYEDGYKPLTNEYESLGVLFEGYVQPASGSTKSAPNFLLGSTLGFSIYFTDTLPTYVSMYVGSTFGLRVGVRVNGVNGYIEDRVTDGEVLGMNWESSTPYRPDQFVSFYVPEGISYLNVDSKMGPYIDDLTFIVDVPEPGILFLFFLGMLMIYMHGKRFNKNHLKP
jgi:hypothetical protein